MNLVEIKETLRAHRVGPSQKLGQNFLHNSHYLNRIAGLADIVSGDRILEIGPGTGALTDVLLAQGGFVRAIEKDRRLVEHLSARYHGNNSLELISGDGLDYLQESSLDFSEWKMVSNLPYSVASPILVELAAKIAPPKQVVATVQLEVADRIRADAGRRDFGLLSLLIQSRFVIGECLRIPSGCFFPVPEVESACISLVRRTVQFLEPLEMEVFRQIARRGFSQRRKMMINLLKQDWPEKALNDGFAQLGLSPRVRAEAVTLEQFGALARMFSGLRQE